MTNEKAMTIREGFERARADYEAQGNTEMVEFFDKRLEQVAKKNAAVRKPTAKQTENEGIKNAIVDWFESGTTYTAADVAKTCPACEGLTVQRVSALLSQLGKAGTLVVSEEKRKHFYTLAD